MLYVKDGQATARTKGFSRGEEKKDMSIVVQVPTPFSLSHTHSLSLFSPRSYIIFTTTPFIYNKPAARRPAAPSNPTIGAPDAAAPALAVVVAAPAGLPVAVVVELEAALRPEVVAAVLAEEEPETAALVMPP